MKIKRQKSGLTLVELIVAITIVAILAATFYAVGSAVEKKNKIDSTVNTIQLLVTALEQYHALYNEFPDPESSETDYFSSDCDNDEQNSEKLYYRLSLCPDAVIVINKIDPEMIQNKTSPNSANDETHDSCLEYIDSWGNRLRYEYNINEGDNFPLITSDGPDGEYSVTLDDSKNDDNITSKDL